MADFHLALDRLLKIEGGYSDRVHDAGGKTNHGITEKLARKYGYSGDMHKIPMGMVSQIYRREFWDRMRLTAVESQVAAEEIFESAVNCGPKRVAKWVQRSLNMLNRGERSWPDLRVDGFQGANTVATLNLACRRIEKNLLKILNILQGYHYVILAETRPSDEHNINGWLNKRVIIG